MNKSQIFELFKTELENNLKLAVQAAQNTYQDATHEDSKAENKYDTRGLEASYLAGAQAKRVTELKEALTVITILKLRTFNEDTPIAITALIELQSPEKNMWIFLVPKGGGQNINFENQHIQSVTPESPLGASLVGKNLDDEISLGSKVYLISQVF
jgi:transcription elongation GreA/GreB family factor